MANTSATVERYSFEIYPKDINGPINLEKTVSSAQTSEPEWARSDGTFTDIELLNGTPVKYTLSQTGSVDNSILKVNVIPSVDDRGLAEDLRRHLNQVLGLSDEVESFYTKFSGVDEPLESTFPKLRGLRLMRGTNLYESLICSMLSQNNSVLLWNRTARLLMRLYGRRVDFPDGSTSFLFPKPETLAKLRSRELQSKTSMGYRAKPVVKVSRLLVNGDLQLDDLARRHYEDAMEMLLELPGVGPKVADCFLLYGAGHLEAAPVDVWIHRITSHLYFGKRKVSRLKTARFLRERFGGWAGYAQLYLFDFARREGLGKAHARKKPRLTD